MPAVQDFVLDQPNDAEPLCGVCTLATWGEEGVDDQDLSLGVPQSIQVL